ncbi:MAG: STAS domain-containing protein [Lentisphaerae bacterium]|nr:STAS domain-containing protein [Lentisphaerota bacterium]
MLKTEMSEGKIILRFENRLDTVTCSGIESEVLSHLEKNQAPVVFDIGKVDFVASAFLRICIMSAKKAGEGNFHVKNAAPQIKKVFKIAGMDQFLAE